MSETLIHNQDKIDVRAVIQLFTTMLSESNNGEPVFSDFQFGCSNIQAALNHRICQQRKLAA